MAAVREAPLRSPTRIGPTPIWTGKSPRSGSPLQIVHDAREFVASSPQLRPRLPQRPSLDASTTPFGSAVRGSRESSSEGKLPVVSGPTPSGGKLPSLSMEDFMRREGLESRCSDPGARGSSHGASRSKRKHHGRTNGTGTKSAPASRGTEVAELADDIWPPDAPMTEPERHRISKSPLMRPHSTVNLGGTTPVRCNSTASLHQNGSSGRPPQVPKRRSAGSRNGERRVDGSSPCASPLSIGDESPMGDTPHQRHRGSSDASPMRSARSAGYPEPPQVPELPLRNVAPATGSGTTPGRAQGQFASGVAGRSPVRSSSQRSLHSALSTERMLASDSARKERKMQELGARDVGLPPRDLRAELSARAEPSSALATAVAPHSSGYAAAADVAVSTATCRTGSKPAPLQGVVALASGAPANSRAADQQAARPASPLMRFDEEDLFASVPEVSYNWDEGDSVPSLNGTARGGSGSSGGPAGLGARIGTSSGLGSSAMQLSILSCTRGPRGGVMSLSVARGSDGCADTQAPSSSSSSSFTATASGGLGETLSSPDAVKGSMGSWVRGEVVGHGSLGSVFKALNQRTGQIFAVKEVAIDQRDKADVKFREALENEVSIYKDLHHPRIVSYLGHDTIGSSLYIYLEYMPGGSVTQVLSQFGAFDESLISTYTRDLLEGLEYLHTRDPVVLHRDVKGANILVGLDCRVKLSDFGCSKRTTSTLSKSLRGSIPWMAPEVIQQTGYGRRSDVWSLGCVVIEMATAQHPWGSFDNPMAAMVKIGMSQATPPLPDNVSETCRDFITECTQRDKNLRPTASELLSHVFVQNAPD